MSLTIACMNCQELCYNRDTSPHYDMTTSTKKTDRQDMADYARSVFGMRSWIADAYADIATAPTPSGRSSASTARACAKLIQDDTGKMDPLVSLLATEVLRLNQAKIALEHNHETVMHLVLDLLDFEHASPDEQERLLTSLRSYITRHECVDDRNFQQYAQALSRVENTPPDYAGGDGPGVGC